MEQLMQGRIARGYPSMTTTSRPDKKSTFLLALPWIALLWLLVGGAWHAHVNERVVNTRSDHFAAAVESASRVQTQLKELFVGVRVDLDLVSEFPAVRAFTSKPSKKSRTDVETFFASLSNSRKGLYLQIRVIDLLGREQIRVDHLHGRAQSIPTEQLQDKSDREYVRKG